MGKIGRKGFYRILNKSADNHAEDHWARKTGKYFSKPQWLVAFQSTVETRLQILHYKILMQIYPTSILLMRMKVRSTELCEKCGTRDSLEHFFYHCNSLRKLWHLVNTHINIVLDRNFILNWEHALFGISSIDNVSKNKLKSINLLILIAKLTVSKTKYGKSEDPCLVFENELSLRGINHTLS